MAPRRLSAIDHVYASPALDPIPFLLRFRSELDPERIVAAFWDTAREFCGVAGTLARIDDHTLGFDVSQDRAEVRVLRAEAGVPSGALFQPLVTEMGGPLARAYVIRETDGTTSIGITLAHVVADGYGCLLFLAAWAARARGAKGPVPICDRSILSAPEARATGATPPPPGNLPESGFVLLERDVRDARLRWEELRLSPASEEWARVESAQRLSFNDLLCARLWKEAVVRKDEDLTTFICYVDVRRQLGAVGQLYFGNAVLAASVTEEMGVVRRTPVAELAKRIRDAVAAVPGRLGAAVAELEVLLAARGLGVVPLFRTFSPTGFAVTNMSRAPFSMLDFGAGPPLEVEVPAEPPHCQGCVVMPAGHDLRLLVAKP